MQQIRQLWFGLDKRRQVIVLLATVAVFVCILAMTRMAAAPSMTLLYAGLENGAAGDVVQSLEQRNVPYEVRGGSIYVPARQRDELRMTLASEGLPANGGRGYELLDSLTGFGTTSQMFDAAYWRAKEGELARTIVHSSHVAQARVHIAQTGSNPFQRNVKPTASVSVMPSGTPVTPEQANAIRFLVSSAVAGMSVEDVAVIDANGALIGSVDAPASANSADDRAQVLREKVLRLVEARVGPGNAVVEVSVDTVTETESIRERRFDPEGRVAISTDTEERTDSSQNQAGGEVTVASNLPDGDGARGDGSQASTSETRERVNYEVSETEHEILKAPGSIRRLTVAVLVNGLAGIDASGAPAFQPRPEEELSALRELVASAVGYDEARGDSIVLRSMDLPVVEPLGSLAGPSLLQRFPLDVMSLVQIAALVMVTLILSLFVIRPILSRTAALPAPDLAALPPSVDTTGGTPALDGEIEGVDLTTDQDATFAPPALTSPSAEDSPVDRLRAMIGDRQEETVEILRSWLEESEEKA